MLTNFPKHLSISKKAWFGDFKKYLSGTYEKEYALLQSRFEYNTIDKEKRQTAPYFIGFDTETYHQNGNMLCLCTSVGRTNYVTGYEDRPVSFEHIVNYLLMCKMSPKALFVSYNLKFDAEVILKSLGQEILTQFYKNDKFTGEYYSDDGKDKYKIRYIPKKFLSIKKNNETLLFFDALQFFIGSGENGKTDLDSVAKLWLGESKKYDGVYKDKKFPSMDRIHPDEFNKIIDYCYKDACLVKNLMDIWVKTFHINFGFYPDKYYSAGYLTSQYFKTQLPNFYSFNDTPYVINELAYKCYFGGRFEIFQRGLIKNVHHYDIKSAYPHAMTQLPDLTNGKWFKLRNARDIFRADMGFFKIRCKVNENYLTPFLLRQVNGLVTCPRGEITTHVTLSELKVAMTEYDMKVDIISGYVFYANKYDETTPFNKLIKEMYTIRQKQTNTGQKYIYKVLLNAGYGKFAQTKPEPRGLFNPVICAFITGHCRGHLLNAVMDNKDDIVMLATDGIFTRKKLKHVLLGSTLGDFDYTFHPKLKLIQAGVYATNTTDDKTLKAHSRGFALKIIENGQVHTFDFDEASIKYNEKHGFHFKVTNRKPLSLVQSIIQNAYSPALINMFTEYTKHIELNGDKKRIWTGTLKNLDTINYSVPIEG